MRKGTLFRLLPAAMIGSLTIAVVVTLIYWRPAQETVQKVVVNPSGEVSSQGLPGDFYTTVQTARNAEGDACAYGKDARGASDNADSTAKQADNAADFARRHEAGYGTLRDAEGTYAGQVDADGVPHGLGVKTLTGSDGTVLRTYRGEWTHGRQDHLGVLQTRVWTYKGHFENGTQSGNGLALFPNGYTDAKKGVHEPGEVYEGQWHNGRPDGYGVLQGGQGAIFAEKFGQFNDLVDSFGVLRRPDGTQLLGSVKHGMRNGACVKINAQDVPTEAGYCVDDALQTRRWPQNPGDKADPFPRDPRCQGFESSPAGH